MKEDHPKNEASRRGRIKEITQTNHHATQKENFFTHQAGQSDAPRSRRGSNRFDSPPNSHRGR